MAGSLRLSAFFHSDEIPGWEDYTLEEAKVAAQVVRSFLTPIRRRWGTVVITDAMTRPSGAHADPGTFDWVPVQALEEGHTLRDVGDWVATYMSDQFGELIVEPPPFGGSTTGHIHSTRRGVGSPGTGEYLIEVAADRFEFGGAHPGFLLLVATAAVAALAIGGSM